MTGCTPLRRDIPEDVPEDLGGKVSVPDNASRAKARSEAE